MPLGLHFNTNVKLLKEIHSIFVTSFVLNRVISHNKLQHTAIGIFPKKSQIIYGNASGKVFSVILSPETSETQLQPAHKQ